MAGQSIEAANGRMALQQLDRNATRRHYSRSDDAEDGRVRISRDHRGTIRSWRDIPVVIVTARDLTAEDRNRLNGGVERIIQKTNRDDMLREVRSVLASCVERSRNEQPVGA